MFLCHSAMWSTSVMQSHSLHLISLMGFIDLIKVLVKEDLYKALQWIIRLGLNEPEVCFDQLSN